MYIVRGCCEESLFSQKLKRGGLSAFGLSSQDTTDSVALKQQTFVSLGSGYWELRSRCQCGRVLVSALFQVAGGCLLAVTTYGEASQLCSLSCQGTDPINEGPTLMI